MYAICLSEFPVTAFWGFTFEGKDVIQSAESYAWSGFSQNKWWFWEIYHESTVLEAQV